VKEGDRGGWVNKVLWVGTAWRDREGGRDKNSE